MIIKELEPSYEQAYEEFVLSCGRGIFYYSIKYRDFLKRLLGVQSEYLIATEHGEILGILPLMFMETDEGRVYNSLPFYGSNGGILTNNPSAHLGLLEAYNEIATAQSTLSSSINESPFPPYHSMQEVTYNYIEERIGQYTSLEFRNQPYDEIFARIDGSARRNIKKARSKGISIVQHPAAINRLRQLHQENIRAIGGKPKNDLFFDLVEDHFTAHIDYQIFAAKYEDRIVAALLLFYYNHVVEYFVPVIDNKFRSDQPLSLIIMHAMVDSAERGFKWWNWGGTWKSQEGVYRFKKKWDTSEQSYHYYTQLNDKRLLSETPRDLTRRFPNFFVVPFDALTAGD